MGVGGNNWWNGGGLFHLIVLFLPTSHFNAIWKEDDCCLLHVQKRKPTVPINTEQFFFFFRFLFWSILAGLLRISIFHSVIQNIITKNSTTIFLYKPNWSSARLSYYAISLLHDKSSVKVNLNVLTNKLNTTTIITTIMNP